MADSVAKRAVRETREMTRLAVDAAKNEIVEELAPAIKGLIERRLREGTLSEDVDRLRRAADGYGETEFEEGTDQMKKKDRKAESISGLFPSISEAYGEEEEMAEGRPATASADEEMDETSIPTLGEADGEEMDEARGAEEDDMDEELEISESELEEMYKEYLQLEVDVKKGFSDMEKGKDIGGTDPDKAPAMSDPASVADVKAGEHFFQDEEPPAKKSWIPESFRRLAMQGLAENKQLREEKAALETLARKLHGKLREMNLFNSKVIAANRFMTRHKLSTEQKKSVVESLDRAGSINEVKRIYDVLESSFRAAGAITESTSRKPKADAQKRRTSAATNDKLLRESVEGSREFGFGRWQELAGLTNGKR